MSAADGDASALSALAAAAADDDVPVKYISWPEPVKEAWASGMELLLESCSVGADETMDAFMLRMACLGYDTPPFRDALATLVRQQFDSYADPAGLIQALGILNNEFWMQDVYQRWRTFEALDAGVECIHPAHGIGVIEEVDSLSSELRVRFARSQRISLDLAVQSLRIIRPGSVLAGWRSSGAAVKDIDRSCILERGRDLIPAASDLDTLKQLLVPDVVSEAVFKKAVAGQSVAVGAQSENGLQRSVAEARSAEELREIIRQSENIELSEGDRQNIEAILAPLAARHEQSEIFRDLVSEIWNISNGAPWFQNFLADLGPSAACWQDEEKFAALADSLTGKNRLQAWLEATAAAAGVERFCELCVGLPHRRWATLERVVEQLPRGMDDLLDCVLARIKSGDASADMVLWLWKNRVATDPLRDPLVLIRTLGKPVKGAYLKAHRDLRRLLVRGDAYHQFLLEGAGEAEMEAIVRTVDHSLVLDHGERQTLLVRLTRLFPDLRAVIERSKRDGKGPARRKQAPVTSPRSYHRAVRQLREINEVKIPENSRAIAHARSYGDLRENAEYKAAKEEQGLLSRKRADLESALDRVKPLDFSVVTDFSRVIPGCTVVIRNEQDEEMTFHVLGLWDSDPDKQMISYDTPVGKVLHSHQVGDVLESTLGKIEIIDIIPLEDDMIQWLNDGGEE